MPSCVNVDLPRLGTLAASHGPFSNKIDEKAMISTGDGHTVPCRATTLLRTTTS